MSYNDYVADRLRDCNFDLDSLTDSQREKIVSRSRINISMPPALNLAADALPPSLAVAQYSLTCGENRNPQSLPHLGHALHTGVYATARLARPLNILDHTLAVRTVLQVDAQNVLR